MKARKIEIPKSTATYDKTKHLPQSKISNKLEYTSNQLIYIYISNNEEVEEKQNNRI